MTTSPDGTELADFAGQLTFRLDPFQVNACEALERGHGVLVCAPTGAGKTEVLRNMLYAGSDALQGLSYVVMDEVHFLADRMRGAVWEEVILHLPEEVRLVSLSATVSNAEEFGGWIKTVRGESNAY